MFTAAAGYERYMGRWSRLLAVEFLDFAAPADGETVLDVGCGTGALSAAVASTRPASPVLGIDPSASFVEHARAAVHAPQVRFEVGDAQALPVPDDSFDAALALLVLNFVPDPARAAAEMARAVRPGGVAAACVWDYATGMQMLRLFWEEAVALDPAAAAANQENLEFTRAGHLAQLWTAAGFAEVIEQPLTISQPFTGFDDYWTPFSEGVGPAGSYLVALPPAQRAGLAARLRSRLLGNGADRPFTLTARCWAVRGRVPS